MPKTDVFIRVWVKDEIRRGFCHSVLARWAIEHERGNAFLHFLISEQTQAFDVSNLRYTSVRMIPGGEFLVDSWKHAALHAESDPYILLEDDILIVGKDYLEYGVKTTLDHPEFGILLSTGEEYTPKTVPNDPDAEVDRTHVISCGFIRRDMAKKFEFPHGRNPLQTDNVFSEQVEAAGLKVGRLRHLRHVHLGQYYSSMNPLHWGA